MAGQRRVPIFLTPRSPPSFPDPRRADAAGLVAIGGDLSRERLLAAYDHGIFPWSDAGLPIMWWSPDPRALLERRHLHVSRSMRRVMARGGFEVSCNRAFGEVMAACADRPEGTWLTADMQQAYGALFRSGDAHSFEVWREGRLIGGLYGVQRGALFAAESMFHREANASKVALIAAVTILFSSGVELFEVQMLTDHLASMGASEVTRDEYLRRLARATASPLRLRPAPQPEPEGAPGPGARGLE